LSFTGLIRSVGISLSNGNTLPAKQYSKYSKIL
jgi:hypothetical protein